MNAQLRNLFVVALAASLPLGLAAQSSSSSSSRPSSTANQPGSSERTGSTSGSKSSTESGSSTMRTPSTASSSTTGSDAGVGSIRRLNDDAAERQFTAKDLIGKEVYDNSGKRIGEVKDIVLASSTNPQLSSGLSKSEGLVSGDTSTTRSDSEKTRTASGSVGGVGASGSVTTREEGVSASGTAGGTTSTRAASNEIARQAQSMVGAMSENAVIISYGGFLGAGSSMLRVPLSQLNYDDSNRRITVNVAETELASLPESTETSRSAAE
jgi:sporulation protein YlmC with PRC-barrel domain